MVTRGLPLGLGGASAGRRLSSLPRAPVAGPLGTNETVVQALVEAALARARSAGLWLKLKQAAGARLTAWCPVCRGARGGSAT